MLNNYLESFYAENHITFFKSVKLNAGLRFDNSSIYNQVLTPRIGLIFPNKRFTAKALYAEAFRAPKNWDYTYGNGNQNLVPERIKSLEISVLYQLGKNLNLDLTVYKNKLTNGLVKNTVLNVWENQSETNVIGLECGMVFEYSKLKIYGNYTYNDSKDEFGMPIPEIANHIGNFGLKISIFKKMKIETYCNYFGSRINNNVVSETGTSTIDDAFIINTALNFMNFKQFDFKLGINNILDAEYYHTSNLQVGRYRQSGRMMILQICYKMK
jgi:outer membrane cobalamin receptor